MMFPNARPPQAQPEGAQQELGQVEGRSPSRGVNQSERQRVNVSPLFIPGVEEPSGPRPGPETEKSC